MQYYNGTLDGSRWLSYISLFNAYLWQNLVRTIVRCNVQYNLKSEWIFVAYQQPNRTVCPNNTFIRGAGVEFCLLRCLPSGSSNWNWSDPKILLCFFLCLMKKFEKVRIHSIPGPMSVMRVHDSERSGK